MIALLEKHTSLKILDVQKLDGYANENYCVKTAEARFLFKTYTFSEELKALVEAENEVLLFLHKDGSTKFPKPIAFHNGFRLKILTVAGEKKIIRLLSFLDGDFFGNVPHSETIFRSLGHFLANMNLQLQQFNSYIYKARKSEWDLQNLSLNRKFIDDIPDAHNRNIVRYFFQQFEEEVAPILPELRHCIIHNDANEWNILTQKDEISGLIDFGDLAYSPLICELAIAITYGCYDKEDPLHWASVLITAYHEVLPLEKRELQILYYLIAARLCISVCNSAHAKKANPENSYTSISEKSAWQMLHRWLGINPTKASNTFLNAAGYAVAEPAPIEEAVQRRHEVLSPIFSLSYYTPIHMERAAFQYMYDVQGNTFLDAYNNIPHVGHSHPQVVDAGQRQMAKLNTNTRYLYDILPEYAEKLLSKFPKPLDKVYFVNSGSAASDLAIRLAYAHTGHNMLMVMEHGYHGNTQMGIAISDYKFSNKKGPGQQNFILKTPIPDTYNGKYTQNDGHAGLAYAKDAMQQIYRSEHPIAAFITEPIVGCGGQVSLAKGYLKEMYPAIRKQGGVCISDEVQTGFGRLGDHFWGFEAQEVVPDIVVLGKPMGNGHPMGAVVTTTAIAESFGKGVEFFSSFGGNPVSCAIGLSVLEVIEEEKLQENAKETGDYYLSLFRELQKKYPCIGDVRGSGLFIGIEIVKDGTKEPATHLAHALKNELREKHILISTDGPFDNVIKSKPPLCFTKANAEMVVEHVGMFLERHYISKC